MSQLLPERRSAGSAERWEPFREFEQVTERMRRMLEQAVGGLDSPSEPTAWTPFVDIEEEDDAYVVQAELPGVKREDVNIELVDKELMITGELKEVERKGILRRQTRRLGHFAYRVVLPEPVDADKIDARLADGVLTVRAPKAERAQRRRVEIKAS